MVWILAVLTFSGFNFFLWVVIGVIRVLTEKTRAIFKRRNEKDIKAGRINSSEVAVIVPAHNEEASITDTISALKKVLPSENIYVGSDASTDKTVEIVKSLGVNVADIQPNRGKARVLVYLLENFKILDRYKAVMIVDADAEVSKDYLKYGLPLFDDSKVVAVAGHGATKWDNNCFLSRPNFFLAYRMRLWRIVQYGMRYGQTWKHTNVTYIVPGSPSMYRTSALKEIKIDAPGLVIEDFNMTFELHHKKLGRIAYSPKVFGVHQDPYTFIDYFKQIRRWNLGFWQTVKRHGFWLSPFWFSTILFSIELFLFSIFIIALPLTLLAFYLNSFQPLHFPVITSFSLNSTFTISDLVIGVFLVDYFMTAITSFFEEKPILLVYGLGFFFLRYIDAISFVYTLPLAFFTKSSGRWQSPERKIRTV